MFKAILVVYIGTFGLPDPDTDLMMVIPSQTVEQCQKAKTDMVDLMKKDLPVGKAYIVECLDGQYLKLKGNQG